MNKDSFLRYVENTRGCDETKLAAAVNRGMYRAKNDRTDFMKLLKLAAACVFTFAVCFSVNLRPIKSAAAEYNRTRSAMMSGSSQVLEGYIKNITGTIERYLGGK